MSLLEDMRPPIPLLEDLRFPIYRSLVSGAIRFGKFGIHVTSNGHRVKIIATKEKPFIQRGTYRRW